MKPAHHLSEDLLLKYAAGNLPEAYSLLAATHASVCGTCREAVELGNELGGCLLDDVADVEMADGSLAALLGQLDAPAKSAIAQPSAPLSESPDPRIPGPVWQALGCKPPKWQLLGPKMHYVDLPVGTDTKPVRLVRLGAGVTVPKHGHETIEYTQMLAGGMIDGDDVYRRGDVFVRTSDHVHTLKIEKTETCLCLVLQEGGLVPHTLRGWLIQKLTSF